MRNHFGMNYTIETGNLEAVLQPAFRYLSGTCENSFVERFTIITTRLPLFCCEGDKAVIEYINRALNCSQIGSIQEMNR